KDRINHPGKCCPHAPLSLMLKGCEDKCTKDSDCPDHDKCCNSGCGLVCTSYCVGELRH
uniref:WAP domain-containing protein n=1 Tax=Gouania willdenowi TaxID=441366 RepID=A0A8C5DAG7_GOUWI